MCIFSNFSAYLPFRTAIRTDNFKLRMTAFRCLAPTFCITGKVNYQKLAAQHLFDLPMPGSNLNVLSESFSVGVSGDAFVRVELDKQQEMSNRWVKTVTRKHSPSHIEKVATIADLRQRGGVGDSRYWFVHGRQRKR